MTTNDEILERASRILEEFKVGELINEFVDASWKYQSTPDVEFSRGVSVSEVPSELSNWVSLNRNKQELIVGWGKFRSSSAPDDDSSYADVFVYLDGEQVLHTSATQEYRDWGNQTHVATYPFAIKAFKAGPWLELLCECARLLDADYKKREEEKRQVRVAEQVSNIDLGDYE